MVNDTPVADVVGPLASGARLPQQQGEILLVLGKHRLWYLPVPFCVEIALLRYRLWDIDILINRTLVYGTLSAILAAVYLSVVILAQTAVGAVDPHATQSPIIIIVSTLLIAVLFTPLRHSLQAGIDRRFYRSKYDATQVMSRFGEAMRQEVNLEQLSEHLVAVVQETLQPSHLSLWLRPRQASKAPELPEAGREY